MLDGIGHRRGDKIVDKYHKKYDSLHPAALRTALTAVACGMGPSPTALASVIMTHNNFVLNGDSAYRLSRVMRAVAKELPPGTILKHPNDFGAHIPSGYNPSRHKSRKGSGKKSKTAKNKATQLKKWTALWLKDTVPFASQLSPPCDAVVNDPLYRIVRDVNPTNRLALILHAKGLPADHVASFGGAEDQASFVDTLKADTASWRDAIRRNGCPVSACPLVRIIIDNAEARLSLRSGHWIPGRRRPPVTSGRSSGMLLPLYRKCGVQDVMSLYSVKTSLTPCRLQLDNVYHDLVTNPTTMKSRNAKGQTLQATARLFGVCSGSFCDNSSIVVFQPMSRSPTTLELPGKSGG